MRYMTAAVLLCAACAAQDAGIVYDIRVFEVRCAVTNAKFERNFGDGSKRLDYIFSLKDNNWLEDTGFPLNSDGDVLYWNRPDAPQNLNILQFANKDGIADGSTLSVLEEIPTHYLAPRPDGKYDLKQELKSAGISVRMKYAGKGQTVLQYQDSRVVRREPVAGVQLDVGKPIDAEWSSFDIATPVDVWQEALVIGQDAPGATSIAIFVRMRGSRNAIAAADLGLKVEELMINFAILHVSKDSKESFYKSLTFDPSFKSAAGEARQINAIALDGETIRPASARLRDLLKNKSNGLELTSSLRITTMTESSAVKFNAAMDRLPKAPQTDMPTEPFKRPPSTLPEFEKDAKPGTAIIADIKSVDDSWAGVTCGVTLDRAMQDDTFTTNLEVKLRSRIGYQKFSDSGFRAQLVLKSKTPAWFTFPEKSENGAYIVEVTVVPAEAESSDT